MRVKEFQAYFMILWKNYIQLLLNQVHQNHEETVVICSDIIRHKFFTFSLVFFFLMSVSWTQS